MGRHVRMAAPVPVGVYMDPAGSVMASKQAAVSAMAGAAMPEVMVGAASMPPPAPYPASSATPPLRSPPMAGDVDRERYRDMPVNPVQATRDQPVSTFSIDVDTAAYANVRRYLRDGTTPPRDAVRIEEMINY
ncbi:MAG: von Willebrand factor type A domain-containing protein, partial [Alphaproteobacteria bacterium]|nr:von Willebrand factor type A domain-containing protein [Alphaproteobacteria bacterium]